jgi:putative restriction endonuclease
MPRRDWTREELIVAFNLYCKIAFGQIHIRNPRVVELANAIGRTPSAVSWKLANFARLDPALRERNVTGATHGARAEVEIWNEFNNNWERLAFESERLLEQLTGRVPELVEDVQEFPKGGSREALIRARVNQGFFRLAVLAAYDERCCMTGLSVPRLLNASHIVPLLNASHIVPWSVDVENRTNPRNGLCLNVLHDRAFDCGLLTVTPDLKVKLSRRLNRKSAGASANDFLWRYEGASISLPRRFTPNADFLRYHSEKVFLDG